MKVCSEKRQQGHPKREAGETVLEFLYRSDRPGIPPICRLMDDWFATYPDNEKDHLRKRLSAMDKDVFHSAFFELYLLTLLRRQGFVVELPRADVQGQRTEDFRAIQGERVVFRLEAKFVGQEEHHAWQDSFQQEMKRSLDQAQADGVWFAVDLEGTFCNQPSPRRVREAFERWYAQNKDGILNALAKKQPLDSLPQFEISETGVDITISPLFQKPKTASASGTVGLWWAGGRWMQTDEKLRKALKRKASRYGKMDVPFIVAVSMCEPADEDDIGNALFGDEVFTIRRDQNGPVGETISSRRPNGFWWGPRGPQNTRVSAILLVNELFPWSVASSQPIIHHNPWAEHAVPLDALPLPQMVPNLEDGRFVKRGSAPIHEVLGLPLGWPRGQ
jgi:hypothetical protein